MRACVPGGVKRRGEEKDGVVHSLPRHLSDRGDFRAELVSGEELEEGWRIIAKENRTHTTDGRLEVSPVLAAPVLRRIQPAV